MFIIGTVAELSPLDVGSSRRRFPASPASATWRALAGIGDMASAQRPGTYGEQLWNRFARIYPGNMARHHAPG